MYPNLLSNLVNDEILAERRRRSQADRLSRLAHTSWLEGKRFSAKFVERLDSLMDSIRIRRTPAPQLVLACSGQVICCPAEAGGCRL